MADLPLLVRLGQTYHCFVTISVVDSSPGRILHCYTDENPATQAMVDRKTESSLMTIAFKDLHRTAQNHSCIQLLFHPTPGSGQWIRPL